MKGVIDASFLLTLLPGDRDRPALARAYPGIREQLELVAPSLLILESGNAIHGHRRARFGPTLAERRRLHRTLLEGIQIVPAGETLIDTCAELAEKHSLTFYDATYLALAAHTKGSFLLSQDQDLLAAARSALGAGRAFGVPEAARTFGAEP